MVPRHAGRGWNAGDHPIHPNVVSEPKDDLFHHPALAYGSRHGDYVRIGRDLRHEAPVELGHFFFPARAKHHGRQMEARICHHRGEGLFYAARLELGAEVFVPDAGQLLFIGG